MVEPHTSVETRTSPVREQSKRKMRSRFERLLAIGDCTPIDPIGAPRDRRSDTQELSHRRPAVASPHNLQPIRPSRTAEAHTSHAGLDERRRLERDLHDGVQNELVALIVKLALATQDPHTPPALADQLAELEARAQAALDSVRNIARGIYPPLLADLGIAEALRALATRAAVEASLVGTAPRSSVEIEEALYFACSEAIQNAAKHAGRTAQLTLRLHHHRQSLTVQIADDGQGFDPAHIPTGAGLQNIRDRIQALGGTFKIASELRRGTVLTISLPWPPRADHRQ